MTNYNLNFTLSTDVDRTKYIHSICSQKNEVYSPKQFSQMADYILLASNKCCSNSTFIYPEEFSNPKRSHIQESLDELLDIEDENGIALLESKLSPIQSTIYKKSQRKIDRNNPILAQHPQMQQLWKEIDRIDSILSTTTNYKLSKLSIALHKQQYDLLESILPQWPASIPSSSPSKNFFNWERGIELENGDYAVLDLTNYTHMAKFLKFLPDLIEYCDIKNSTKYLSTDLYQLIQDTLQAIRNAALSPLQQDVLSLYWLNQEGKQILTYLYNKYGKKYNQSTLSTMFNVTISKKICTEYKEIYEERLYKNCPEHWRKCSHCGTIKLLSTYNFHRASGKPKGYSLICKDCFREKRQKKEK